MNKSKLGTYVRCKSFMKRVKIKPVFLSDEKVAEKNDFPEFVLNNKTVISLERETQDGNVPYEQEPYIKVETEFYGYIIATKKLPMKFFYDFDEWGDYINIEKCCFIDCYVVAYRMGATKIVPKEDVFVMEGANEDQIEMMKHALFGWTTPSDLKKPKLKAYRNRYIIDSRETTRLDLMLDLVRKNYMTVIKKQKDYCRWFHVTNVGVKFLEDILGKKIIQDKEDIVII